MLNSLKKDIYQVYVKIKRRIKRPFYRINAKINVAHNVNELDKKGRIFNKLYLKQKFLNGGTGSLDNYYHFNFDLILPLYLLLSKNENLEIFLVEEGIGYFKFRITEFFSERVKFISNEVWLNNDDSSYILGMNPIIYKSKPGVLNGFKAYLINQLSLVTNYYSRSIVVIERGKTDPKKLSKERQNKGSGTDRRSISNHKELLDLIEEHYNPKYKLINVKLEDLEFKQQIEMFDNASLVIGQHGAGLTNCLWMKSGAKVIEISNNKFKSHFARLCQQKEISHTYFETKDEHTTIDLTAFETKVINNKLFSDYFN